MGNIKVMRFILFFFGRKEVMCVKNRERKKERKQCVKILERIQILRKRRKPVNDFIGEKRLFKKNKKMYNYLSRV